MVVNAAIFQKAFWCDILNDVLHLLNAAPMCFENRRHREHCSITFLPYSSYHCTRRDPIVSLPTEVERHNSGLEHFEPGRNFVTELLTAHDGLAGDPVHLDRSPWGLRTVHGRAKNDRNV